MTAALVLLLATLAVVTLPLLPALREWRRPSDVTPLPIDEADALEPDYLARRFAQRIDHALKQGVGQVGDTPLSNLPRSSQWPAGTLTKKEQRTGRSERIWYSPGDAVLPQGLHGLAEIAARGLLRAAGGHTYRALLAGGRLLLPPRVRVMRWAHGRSVVVGDQCRLSARISADELILLGRNVSFSLLHAPAICFAGLLPADAQGSLAGIEGVTWVDGDSVARVDGPLTVPALRHWQGDLAVAGHVSLGEGCVARGSIQAAGMISLGAGALVTGALTTPGEIYLAPGVQVRASIVSESAVVLGPGCVIGVPGAHATVRAPRVDIGKGVIVHGRVWSGSRLLTVGDAYGELDQDGPQDREDGVYSLDDGVEWDDVTGRGVALASLRVAPGRSWDGDLVCHGDLSLGPRCHAAGALKAHGDIGLGAGGCVDGSVIAQGEIVVGAGVHVLGSVASETAVVLGPGCQVGAPGRPATVCAPRIEVALGVVVHGTVWAGDSGDALGTMQLLAEGGRHNPNHPDDHGADDDAANLPGRAAA